MLQIDRSKLGSPFRQQGGGVVFEEMEEKNKRRGGGGVGCSKSCLSLSQLFLFRKKDKRD